MLGEPTPGMVHEVQTAATALKRAIALLGGGDTLGEGEETQQPWLAAWDVDRSTQRVRMVERFALREMLQVWERGAAWRGPGVAKAPACAMVVTTGRAWPTTSAASAAPRRGGARPAVACMVQERAAAGAATAGGGAVGGCEGAGADGGHGRVGGAV